jgi:SNF family Na+-dependent transporter
LRRAIGRIAAAYTPAYCYANGGGAFLIPYLIAALHWLIQVVSIPMLYRLITALAYASGPVALYLFARYLTRRESTAFVSAIIYSVGLMPIYGVIPFAAGFVIVILLIVWQWRKRRSVRALAVVS